MTSNNKNKIDEGLLVDEEKTTKFTASSPAIKLSTTELVALWETMPPISSKNPSIFRLDPGDALIKLSDFGKKTPHGWVVQPVDLEHMPIDPDINNLIGIHWMNAESRLKSSKKNAKSFVTVVTRVDDPLSDNNTKKEKLVPNKNLIKQMTTNSMIWSKKERKGFKSNK